MFNSSIYSGASGSSFFGDNFVQFWVVSCNSSFLDAFEEANVLPLLTHRAIGESHCNED